MRLLGHSVRWLIRPHPSRWSRRVGTSPTVTANERRQSRSMAPDDALPDVRTDDFDYHLPEERVAKFPLADRSASKLLVFEAGRSLRHRRFVDLPQLLPSDAVLVRNNSKVIAARLLLHKERIGRRGKMGGGKAELLCLEPLQPSTDPTVALACTTPPVVWSCYCGGRRIHNGTVLHGEHVRATMLERVGMETRVRFDWTPGQPCHSFADVLEREGHTPLPPYLRREDVPADRRTYQTVYASREGSVAAPTAGLHFTSDMIERHFADRVVNVTLHVGAGTFAPILSEAISGHQMHRERACIERAELERLVAFMEQRRPIAAVGTTSARTLESLHWHGAALLEGAGKSGMGEEFWVSQWQPYNCTVSASALDTYRAVLRRMDEASLAVMRGYTNLLIVPPYEFQVVDALVTNFHRPRSTLLMLVAALVPGGRDTLMHIYEEALKHEYRFLSYGDSSLLTRRPMLRQ
eukprot:ctg_940.g399